jgi:hypothetical protein
MPARGTPNFGDENPPEATGSASLEDRIKDLEAALAASQAAQPLTLTPLHGAGPGLTVAETWSQADQEASRAG